LNDKQKWPRREKLVEALDRFNKFREACKLQLDLGYAFKVDFPSKLHLNKILSIQYIDRDVVEQIYGPALSKQIYIAIPHIKNYIKFTQEQELGQELKDVANNK
jgi:hypothetical protein